MSPRRIWSAARSPRFDAITVVPGAVGAWRRAALDEVGGYPVDTLAEDQDLTIAIQRAGWRVDYDADAVAWTEAPRDASARSPSSASAGRSARCNACGSIARILRDGKPRGLALVGMPQAWLFQIVFALISPLIDLALAGQHRRRPSCRVQQHGWAQTQTDVLPDGRSTGCVFTAIDLLCGWIAYRLDAREKRFPAFLLLAQRFVYRQLMYWVVITRGRRGAARPLGRLGQAGAHRPGGRPA